MTEKRWWVIGEVLAAFTAVGAVLLNERPLARGLAAAAVAFGAAYHAL